MIKDLIVLAADRDAERTLNALFERFPKVLNCNEFTFDILIHPNRDSGCRTDSHNFLKMFASEYKYCMLVFDYEGSGGESLSVEELEKYVQNNLEKNGWQDRCVVIVIKPELENWIWAKSEELAKVINWKNLEELENWLISKGYKEANQPKPNRPKEAFEAALRKSKKRFSASIFEDVAQKASFRHCIDDSFIKLKETIKKWFV